MRKSNLSRVTSIPEPLLPGTECYEDGESDCKDTPVARSTFSGTKSPGSWW